ncbi:zf-HC2 domain-containing protein [Peribacillus sp. NPDC097675]|uniref:zf-HC2 domain-containing protein n=1 Tax=Peribacillus sp. NPDC097675 TaxID=3390618 RepID=UPI003D01E16E
MNDKCAIVRDLLPSYIDDICSKESKQFVGEHLGSCDSCRNILNHMKSEVDFPDELNTKERMKAKKPFKQLSEIFKSQKKLTFYVQSLALISLVLGIFFLTNSIAEMKEYKQELRKYDVVDKEKEGITTDVFHILGSSNSVSKQEKEQLLHIFDKYQDKLSYLSIFPAGEIEDWVEENKSVEQEPTTIYPVDYQKAMLVIGSDGFIDRKEQITPSDYDLGNVVMANDKWVVQYEYKDSYESTIERHHQLKYYGPSYWSFFQLPILFFIIFIVVGIIWYYLNEENSQLNGLID